MSEYTREEILKMIEEVGGPENLDLSGKDLSGIDLSKEAITKELEKYRQNNPDQTPLWFSQETGGMDLHRAILKKADLSEAHLERADLEGTHLEGASLWGTHLERAFLRWADLEDACLLGANLEDADLTGANLETADLTGAHLDRADLAMAHLEGAYLLGANLKGANLWWAQLEWAILMGAHLEKVDLSAATSLAGAYFHRAWLDQTRMTKEQLGGSIGEEIDKEHHQAKEAYLLLKNNFNQIGRYDDASWAYIKERQMEKKTHWPLSYAFKWYGESELPKEYGTWSRRVDLLRLYLRHLRLFITDWITELLCLYGESPLRVVAWAAALAFLIFPLLYALFGGVVTADGSPVTWGEYLRLSLASFATIELANVQAQGIVAQFLRTLEALAGISLLALLMFTVGNRISRS